MGKIGIIDRLKAIAISSIKTHTVRMSKIIIDKSYRAWLEIDLKKIQSNYQAIKDFVGSKQVMPVLKANAYGLGMKPICKALQMVGADTFGVANVNEALALYKINAKRVQVLGDVTPYEIELAIKKHIILPLSSLETARAISDVALKLGISAQCEILIDTGMGRLGLWWQRAYIELEEILKLPHLKIEGVYSHFPNANEDLEFSKKQIRNLSAIHGWLKKQLGTTLNFHIANSDGINNISQSIEAPFNLVRTGINLYGVYDMQGRQRVNIQSVITLKSRLIAIKTLPAGTSISYGCSDTLTKSTRLGTISLGYADGLPLALSQKGYVMVHGKACKVLGRVTMDYTIIDLSNVPHAKVSDEVICLGDEITVSDWACLKQTHEYEIICSLGNRVDRIYKY